MSEDSRRHRKVLRVRNPGSDDDEPPYEDPRPQRTLPSYHRPMPSQTDLLSTDFVLAPLQYAQQPPLSPDSTGSPSASTPPSGLHAPSAHQDGRTGGRDVR